MSSPSQHNPEEKGGQGAPVAATHTVAASTCKNSLMVSQPTPSTYWIVPQC